MVVHVSVSCTRSLGKMLGCSLEAMKTVLTITRITYGWAFDAAVFEASDRLQVEAESNKQGEEEAEVGRRGRRRRGGEG